MKKNIIGITLFLVACFILWESISPQLQLQNQTSASLKTNTKKINSLLLRIQRLEKELNQLKKVIKITGVNVEINSPGNLKLKGMNLEFRSQTNMNMNANLKIIINGKSDMLLKSGAKMTLKSNTIFLN